MKTVEHFPAVTRTVVDQEAHTVLRLNPTQARAIAGLLAHVQSGALDKLDLPHPNEVHKDWSGVAVNTTTNQHVWSCSGLRPNDPAHVSLIFSI